MKQAPRAWYERLIKFLLENDFKMGKIDTTFFIKTKENEMLIVQIPCSNTIIFCATNVSMKNLISALHSEFEMSMME